jgi:YVTN family beta-propeller protein
MTPPRPFFRSTKGIAVLLVLTLLGSVLGVAATAVASDHPMVRPTALGSPASAASGAQAPLSSAEVRGAADTRAPSPSGGGIPIGESVQSTLALLNGSLQAGGVTTYNGLGPDGVAYAPTSNQLFVSEVGTDSVSVVDATTWKVVASIPVGAFPAGLVYDGATGYIYEANAETGNLSVINPLTDRAVASIPTPGVSPYQLAYDSTNGYLYVGNAFGDNVSVIDPATALPVASITIGLYVSDVAFDSVNGEIYATANVANVVGFIDGATNTLLGNLTVGTGPLTLCVDARNGYVYVGNTGGSTVTVIDGATNVVVTSISATGSEEMLVDPTNTELYVADSNGGLTAYDTYTNLSVATMRIGSFPQGIALDGSSGYIFTANRDSNNLSAADPSTNTIVGAVQLGSSPFALVDVPSTGTVAVLDSAESTLDIIDRAHQVAGRVPLNAGPSALAYDPGNGNVYVADGSASDIVEVNTSSMQVVHEFAQGSSNWGAIAFDRATGRLMVAGGSLLASVDPGSGLIVGTAGIGPGPHSIAVDGATGLVFVANGGGANNITVVDGGSMTVVANVSVGATVSSLALDLADGEMYAAVPSEGLVLELDGASGAILANVTTQTDPVSLSYDPSIGGIWVLDDSFFAPPTASPIVGGSFWSNWTVSFPASIDVAAFDPLSQAPVVISQSAGAVYFLTPAWGYSVSLAGVGLPPATSWQASVGVATLQGPTTTLSTTLANGSYAYQISAPAGFVATPASGEVVVNGTAVVVSISFRPIPAATYPLGFSETGLPAGKPWTVSVNGSVSTALGIDLNVSLSNGTYGYFVGSPAGYGATPADGIVAIAGLSRSISLVFAPVPANGPPPANNSSRGTQRAGTNTTTTVYPATWLWLLTGLVVAEAAALVALALLLGRRPGAGRAPSPPSNYPPPPGAQGPPGT